MGATSTRELAQTLFGIKNVFKIEIRLQIGCVKD